MRYKKLFEVAIMEVKVKSISINSPAVKINTEFKLLTDQLHPKKISLVLVMQFAYLITFFLLG